MFSIDSNGRVWRVFAALSILCALNSGCKKQQAYERVSVSGQVLVDGAPLKMGYVRFIPSGGGRSAITSINASGKFDFGDEGVVVGKNRIEVLASEQIGATGYRWHAPAKYASSATSGLEQEITGPTNEITLDLRGDGGKPVTTQPSAEDSDPKNLKSRQ